MIQASNSRVQRILDWFRRTLPRASLLVGVAGALPVVLVMFVYQPPIPLAAQGLMVLVGILGLAAFYYRGAKPLFLARQAEQLRRPDDPPMGALTGESKTQEQSSAQLPSVPWAKISDRSLFWLVVGLSVSAVLSVGGFVVHSASLWPFAVGAGLSAAAATVAWQEWRRRRR